MVVMMAGMMVFGILFMHGATVITAMETARKKSVFGH